MTGLILHAGAQRATRLDVEGVATPEATDTWQPIPHVALVDSLVERFAPLGWSVQHEQFGLWRGGDRFFGVLTLGGAAVAGTGDYTLAVGIRNSHDRSMSAGIAVGSRVFVCDNLAFSGEVSLTRKHSSQILADLPSIMDTVIDRSQHLQAFQARRIETYKGAELGRIAAHDLVIRAMDAGVISGALVPHVLKEWREPRHEEFRAPTAWSLFNAFTEVLKGSARLALPRRTMALHKVVDSYVGVLPAPAFAPSEN
jgi:hypothetical protein